MSLRLDWCDQDAMKFAVLNWHYAKRLPSGKLAKIGVWEDGIFRGAVVFGRGGAQHIGSPYGLDQTQVCELVRVALKDCRAETSRVVRIALRMITKAFGGLRLVVSYADTAQCHVGIIYQASGWVYCGVSKGDTEVWINGKWCHRSRRPSSGLKTRRVGDKHKYLMPLDDEMRKQIAPLAKPYPKRLKGHAPDTLGEVDGSTPIQTLQFEDGTQ